MNMLRYEGDTFPLALVQHRLAPHRAVLRHLVRLVAELARDGRRGVMVLDAVYRASTCGVTRVAAAMTTVLAEGHKLLYTQLLAWLLQGALYDPHHEFFIVRSGEAGEESLLAQETEHGDTAVARSKSGQYRLELGMVPGHISPQLAEKIFFIGESIQLFESDKRVEVGGAVLREREGELYRALAQLQQLRDSGAGSQLVTSQMSQLGQFVDKIRGLVSAQLHHLVVEEGGLLAELATLWDVFTLARGELVLAFIRAADPRLVAPPTAATQHDTSLAWQGAVAAVTDAEAGERLLGRARVVLGEGGASGWEQLRVQYAVPWPLHLVLTPASLDRYNAVFRFLLLVRRTQAALHTQWAERMFGSRARGRERGAGGDTAGQTRQHMIFLVDNLQYYVMADVLATQTRALSTKIAATNSFEEVKLFHDQFLTQVQASLFLFNEPVSKCLVDTMNVILKFCAASSASSQSALSTAFSHHSFLLLKLLSSLRHQMAPTSLAQLLTRIDYNRYFSNKDKTKLRSNHKTSAVP